MRETLTLGTCSSTGMSLIEARAENVKARKRLEEGNSPPKRAGKRTKLPPLSRPLFLLNQAGARLPYDDGTKSRVPHERRCH
jgi:hypothetical protein